MPHTAANELQAWLADPARQRTTQAAIDGFAARWNEGPVQHSFEAALAVLPEPTGEAVADAVRTLFANDDWVESLLAGLAAELRADPFFEPPFRPVSTDVHSGLIVFEDPRVTISVGVAHVARLAARKAGPRGPTSIGFSGRLTLLKFVRAGSARIRFWEADEITPAFRAAGAGTCRSTGTSALSDGDVLLIDGRRRTYVIEHARANLLILQAEINLGQAPLSVEYDSASQAYLGCSANGDGASRIQMISSLLGKLGAGRAFPAIAAFLDHEDFFVRWHVMKELLGLDAEAALPHLKRMAARDPHPEPRRAARSVLDRIETPATRKVA